MNCVFYFFVFRCGTQGDLPNLALAAMLLDEGETDS